MRRRKKVIVNLDVVTVAEWDSKREAIQFINRIKKEEFNLFTPYILLEHLSKWKHKNLVSKIEHFYRIYSKTIISAQNVLDRINEIRVNRNKLTNELLEIGVKEEDAILVVITSIFGIDYLVTFNRKHLKNKEVKINEVLKKNGLKTIKIYLPDEI